MGLAALDTGGVRPSIVHVLPSGADNGAMGSGRSEKSGRRARRGKPLAEMNAAEVKRALWVMPLVMVTMWLAAVGRLALLAIQEEIALWLAVVLALVFAALPALLVIREQRRFRARLDQLRDPILGSLPAAEVPSPLPRRLWLSLIATPVLVVLGLVFVARAPGAGNTCVSKGIATTAAREGICQREATLVGGGFTYNVVDSGHTLRIPGYSAQLLGSEGVSIPVAGPNADARDYPHGEGLLLSFEIAITNTGHGPLTFDTSDQDVEVGIPNAVNDPAEPTWTQSFGLQDGPRPQFASAPAISPGATRVGWFSFIVPIWAGGHIHSRFADLDLEPADGPNDYLGQIRLWKAATAAGRKALEFRAPRLTEAARST
jgi:hypothetical protein